MRDVSGRTKLRGVVLSIALCLALVAVVGCAGQSSGGASTSAQTDQAATQGGMGGGMASEMTCAMCNKGAPAVEKGTATVENGVQVCTLTLKDGYYSPNQFTVKSDMPVKLVFTGTAKDCSGKPKIGTLGKQVDFTGTGTATMDLGDVKPGTYEITCGMDSPGGSLIVE